MQLTRQLRRVIQICKLLRHTNSRISEIASQNRPASDRGSALRQMWSVLYGTVTSNPIRRTYGQDAPNLRDGPARALHLWCYSGPFQNNHFPTTATKQQARLAQTQQQGTP